MSRSLSFALVASILAAGPLAGQLWDAAPPGEEVGSVALNLGVVSPATKFADDRSHFERGTALGVSLTYWPFSRFGLRTHVLRGETEGNHGDLAATCPPAPCSPVGYQDPVVWHYSLEAAVRRPMGGPGGFAWFPYVSGGITGKSYRWSIDIPRIGYTAGGLTAAGGVEMRTSATGPLGFMAEVRTYQTRFQHLGKDERHSDLALVAGVTLSR